MRYVKYRVLGTRNDEDSVVETENNRPKDWGFMEESEKVLANIPDTWKAYPQNIHGGMSIISMEYEELMKAPAEERMHELVHLASACLHLWRMYNDSK